MKKIRIVSMLVLVMFLLSSVVVSAYDASDLETYLYREDAEVGKIIAKNSTPTIDANISTAEGWSDAKHLDYTNMPTFWGASSRCIMSADLYFAWDTTGIYVAANIADPTMVKTTGEDINSPEYAWDGDVFVFGIDPLAECFNSGMTTDKDMTAWYCIAVGEGNAFRIYRTNVNDGDIADSVVGAANVSDAGWSFECLIPWELIIDDTMVASMGDVQLTVEEITTAGAISNAGVMYIDRAVLSDDLAVFMSSDSTAVNGDTVTISRNISVPMVHDDGQGWGSGGSALRSYGIDLTIGDATGFAPETTPPAEDTEEDTTELEEKDPVADETEEEPAEVTEEVSEEEEEDETTTKADDEPKDEKEGAPIGLIIGIVAANVVVAAVVVVIIIKKKK